MDLDVITIGRCSVDLYGQQIGGRLEDMASFAKYVGGCPANIAIGTARLGLKSGFVSRVGQEHMGSFIREKMTEEGVETSCLRSDPHRLTALVILGIRDQTHFPLIFFRENCADMAMNEDDIDTDYIRSARSLVVTGTHFAHANTARAQEAAMAVMQQEKGGKVIFDIDYRPVLWGLTGHDQGEERFVSDKTVTQHLQRLLPQCDIIVGTEEEFHIAAGTTDTDEALQLARSLSKAVLVCKRGPLGCSIYPGAIKDGLHIAGNPIDVHNVLGAGDAFMSGLLYGVLNHVSWYDAGRYANACGALVVSRHGCAPAMPNRAELDYYLKNGSTYHALRFDPDLNHYHRAATRRKGPAKVMALAIDHRSQFEDIAKIWNQPNEKIGHFKTLALDVVKNMQSKHDGLGMLLDDKYGKAALHEASDSGLWLARPVELPRSRPLRFEPGEDIGSCLLEWPLCQIVKCLVFYHPDDPQALREDQEQSLRRLYEACLRTGHELLLEVIASKAGLVNADSLAGIIRRFYEIGIKPDWWKLEPSAEAATWQQISEAIKKNDPFCKGVVVLGLDAQEEELAVSFALAKQYDIVRGFAVGRTIFGQAAQDWFAGKIDDQMAKDQMAARFRNLIRIWEQ